jgi:polyisoprenyl-phosphate glycosyltransferase
VKKLSVVVPVYFNEGSIPALFERLQGVEKELIQIGLELELIFVDDGSKDGSLHELLKIKKIDDSVKVIKLTRNFGAVHASKAGLQFVTGDCFMILAADLQDPPETIIAMAKEWFNGSKFVICERNNRDDPQMTKLFASIYYKIIRKMVVHGYPERGFDLALMDKSMLPYLQNNGKSFHTPLYAYWLGFKPVVLKYERAKREHGRSMWTFGKKVNAFLDVFLGFSRAPIRMISLIGLVTAILSFGYGSAVAINALFGDLIIPGFATIAALITFLLGLVILMLGMIGEYLWRIFDEVTDRPESVIDEIY